VTFYYLPCENQNVMLPVFASSSENHSTK